MGFEAWFTIAVVISVLIGLILYQRAPDVVLLAGLTVLLVTGTLSAEEALAGFSNQGMITVAVLFVVVTGMRETGAMTILTNTMLGRPNSLRAAQARIMIPAATMSAFLNNTPIVAMMLPVIGDWGRKHRISVSKLLIPLSYAAILGGTCTLIGTSTNLVVNGLVLDYIGETQPDPRFVHGLGMFEIAWVGVPAAIIGIGYMLLLGSTNLLRERKPVIDQLDDPREYTVEMVVEPGSPLVGKSIEEAGLRHLPGMYLVEIDRGDRILAVVSPQEKLHADDRLVFVGVVESVVDLQRIRGLTPATNQVFKLDQPRHNRCLLEAVVSNTCPLIGKSIREGRFRTTYNAAVIAVARNGQRINKKIGDIVLRPGDTLLLEAGESFAKQQRNSRDFYLVSRVDDSTPPRHERAYIALAILGAMVISVTSGLLTILTAAMLAGGLMLITRCCTASEARRNVDWQVLLVIGAAFGIGRAMDTSGAAGAIAASLIGFAGENPWLVLIIVYGVTMLFTELITNNAAAVLVFPIALSTARELEVSFMPFVIAIMVAASVSLITPIGYQTNLMVYGPGGYRFSDYTRIGLPLSLILWAVTVTLAPIIWPF
ncbi:MAG: SLC13 family permease [Phycisphaeraceae bacterium]